MSRIVRGAPRRTATARGYLMLYLLTAILAFIAGAVAASVLYVLQEPYEPP
jgi:hypothetical protein